MYKSNFTILSTIKQYTESVTQNTQSYFLQTQLHKYYIRVL